MQINIQSWAYPSNHVRFHNDSMVWMPYNMNPFGATFPVLDWHNIMKMEYPLAMHRWNLAWVICDGPHYSFVNTAMIMDQQHGISRPNATLLEKNKYCVNSLQCMATKCELDKRGVLLFPKIIHGHTHAEYISSRSCNGLVFNQGTQVIDLCGQMARSHSWWACKLWRLSHGGVGCMLQHYGLQDQCLVLSILYCIFPKMEKY